MRKNKILIKILVLGIIVLASVTSCKKDYFDINTDPNYPSNVDIAQLLPTSEAAIAHVIGNNFQIFGGLYSEYWTQSPTASQYKTIEQYAPGANDFDAPWRILYDQALTNLKVIQTKANAEGKANYTAISKILSAYTFQLLTDNFGDVPYSEALKGPEGLLAPKYDRQEDIYNGIISMTKEGISLIDESSDLHPTTDDLLYGGDMSLWRKFGNTLLLKMYLRLSEVSPAVAQQGITELDAAGAQFLGSLESGQVKYFADGGNTNPLYSEIIQLGSTQNLVASATAINYFLGDSINDPRLTVFYNTSLNGSYVGLPQGLFSATPGIQTSYPGNITGGYAADPAAALAPVNLISATESFFLQSEAAQRGWLISADAKGSYEAGITESFQSLGLTQTDLDTFMVQTGVVYPVAGSATEQLKSIMTMKWASLCGTQNIEAWADQRRTGYPDFFVVSAASLYGTTILPERLLYPSTEVTRNGNFPGQKLIYNKVWWDVN